MIVNLFVVRIVLLALGAENYGIYYVVAGIVTLFTFISTSLSSGAQRFFAIDIGKKDYYKLSITFSLTIYTYFAIGIFSLILLETIGVWFLNTKLNIPHESITDANIVFQFSILSFIANIFIIPFNAVVIAYEKMSFFAYLSIAEGIAKFTIACLLIFINTNKLILYAILLSVISLLILFIYIWYTKRNLSGCSFVKINSYKQGLNLLKYSGWNMIGAIAILLRNQGLTILLNIFFTPIVSAAQTIGQQMYGATNQLISNIYTASRPQITKHYSINEIDAMWKLIFLSGKIAYFLLLLIIIPLFICCEFILCVWLSDVPQFTSLICRMLLLSLLIETFTNQIIASFQAANRLKKVQCISSMILLMNIPLSYLFLKFYSQVIIPYIVMIFLSCVYSFSIILIAKYELHMPLSQYFKELFFPSLLVLLSAPIVPIIIHFTFPPGWINFALTLSISTICTSFAVWILGLSHGERQKLKLIIKSNISKYEITKGNR